MPRHATRRRRPRRDRILAWRQTARTVIGMDAQHPTASYAAPAIRDLYEEAIASIGDSETRDAEATVSEWRITFQRTDTRDAPEDQQGEDPRVT